MLTSLVPTCRRLCGIKKQAIFDDLSGATLMKNVAAVCGSSKNPRF